MYPCSGCGKVRKGKAASVYWAWFPDDESREGWKWRLCFECAGLRLPDLAHHFEKESNEEDADCASCRQPLYDTAERLMITLYLPQADYVQALLQLHTACFEGMLQGVKKIGSKTKTSLGQGGGPPALTQDWAGLGIGPRS